jgi:hypothetical protein
VGAKIELPDSDTSVQFSLVEFLVQGVLVVQHEVLVGVHHSQFLALGGADGHGQVSVYREGFFDVVHRDGYNHSQLALSHVGVAMEFVESF